jgi:hypothetical protein
MGICIITQGVPFKMQPDNNHILQNKNEIRSRSTPNVIDSQAPPMTFESRSPWLLGHCSCQLCIRGAGVNIVYSRAERVHSRTSLCIYIICCCCKAFSIVYHDKAVPNETTIYRLVTKFQDMGSICGKCSLSDKTAEITAVPISSVSCNTRIQLQEFNVTIGYVVRCIKVFMCSS